MNAFPDKATALYAVAAQLDYLLFLQGMAFLMLAAVCFMFRERTPRWWALGLFALIQGPAEWLEAYLLNFNGIPAFAWIDAGLHALVLFFATSFAGPLFAPPLGALIRWLPLPLSLAVAGIGIVWGEMALGAASIHAFCATAGLLAGAALFNLRRSVSPDDGWLAMAGAGLIFYGLSHALAESGESMHLLPGLGAFLSALSLGIHGRSLQPAGAGSWLRPAIGAGSLILILGLGWGAAERFGHGARVALQEALNADARLLANGLEARMRQADGAAQTIARLPRTRSRLAGDGPAEDAVHVDSMLDSFRAGLGPAVVYLMDAGGTVVAASNRDQPDSFMGRNYAFRPYFREAMAGQAGRAFALGVTSGKRGYYAGAPVSDARGRRVGVAVVKIEVDDAEASMRGLPLAFLIDPHGVAFLSSRPGERFRALWPLPDEATGLLLESRQFGRMDARPLLPGPVQEGSEVVLDGDRHLAARLPVGPPGWSVLLFRPAHPVAGARLQAMGGAAFLGAMVLVFLVFLQRESAARAKSEIQRRELEDLSRELQRQATTDTLTGACNRLKLHETLPNEILRAKRYGAPLSVIMLDIDHFKQVNDTYGHLVGDRVLVWLAERVGAGLRETDQLFRWGGEEFMVLAPNAGRVAATQAAERIRQSIEQSPIEPVGRVTCSFGVAEYRSDDTAESLSDRADTALYRAKILGRNRVECEAGS